MSDPLAVDETGNVSRPAPRLPPLALLAVAVIGLWSMFSAGFYSRRLGEAAGVTIPDPDYPIRKAVELVQSAIVPVTTPTPFLVNSGLFDTNANTLLTFTDFGSTGEISTPTITIHADGTVTIKAGVTLDSASLAFWHAVGSEGFLRSQCE